MIFALRGLSVYNMCSAHAVGPQVESRKMPIE